MDLMTFSYFNYLIFGCMEIFKSDIHQSYIDKIKVKNNITLYNLKY